MIEDLDLTNFNAGEWSPRLKGRFDQAKYYNACETVRNMVMLPQGGATRRPGTMLAAKTGNQSTGERLIPFIFSTSQAYTLGFGDGYIRFYFGDALVVSGGSPVQLSAPYTAADAKGLEYVQSFDTMFLFHRNYPPMALTRTGAAAFSIAALAFRDGPYEDENGSDNNVTVSDFTGSITCTWQTTSGINGGAGFGAGDVGRLVRISLYSLWAWLVITSVTNATTVIATVQDRVGQGAWGELDGAPWQPNFPYIVGATVRNGVNSYQCTASGVSAGSGGPTGTGTSIIDGTAGWQFRAFVPTNTTRWRLGRWAAGNGFPGLGMFWQNRLVMLGTSGEPNLVCGSVTGDFTNLSPSQADDTVTDSNAFIWLLADDQENDILWVSPAGSAQAMQLGIGTSGGEDILQAASTSQALTPTNVQHYRETSYGSAPDVRPARIGKSVLFSNRTGRKLHEWTFNWQVNGYLGPDLAVLAEHITKPNAASADALGIVQIAYQQSPHSVLWAIRSDGQLIGLTYLREQDIVGWHQHQLGGQYYGGPPIVESIAVIPAPNGGYDELWLEVLRTIGGTPTRTVEVMTAYFDGESLDQAWFVDCGLRNTIAYPAATVTPSGLTALTDATRATVWTGAGSLKASVATWSAGDVGSFTRLNGGKARITGFVDTETVTIAVLDPLASMAPAASGVWSQAAPVSSVAGLDHLDGEMVAILADGQVNTAQIVSAGTVTLQSPAGLVTAGLPFSSALVTMPYEPARAAGSSAHGKLKRVLQLYLRLHETVGGAFGVRQTDPMTFVAIAKTLPIPQRVAGNPMGQSLPLFSGAKKLPGLGSYDREGQFMILQQDPLPLTVLAVTARADVEEVMPQ